MAQILLTVILVIAAFLIIAIEDVNITIEMPEDIKSAKQKAWNKAKVILFILGGVGFIGLIVWAIQNIF